MVIRRSVLFSPASSMSKMEKAAVGSADQVILDLEDAVSPSEKDGARENVIAALEEFDWSDTYVAVRTNALDTRHAYRDFIDIVERAGHILNGFVPPKICHSEDIYAIDTLLTQVEAASGIEIPIQLQPLIEVTEGLSNVDEIAAGSDRIESLVFGPGDFSASIGIDHPSTVDNDVYDDIWHYPRFRIANAAATNGLDAIDGAYSDFADREGYRADCEEARAHGFAGKLAIHPNQVEVANEVFTPSDDEISFYQRVLAKLDEGNERGDGAVSLDGVMLDVAHRQHAERVLGLAEELDLVNRKE